MRRDTRKTWALRAVGAALFALTFGYGPYHLYSRSGFSDYLGLRRELSSIEDRNAHLRLEVIRLSSEVQSLRSDPRALEREIRSHLRWVRPGEVVFDLGAER